MKKITLLFFLTLLPLCAFAQLPEEGFEGSWPPAGWTIDDNGIGPAASWTQSILNNPLQPPYEGDYAAYINKENVATGIPEDWLITPQFTMPDNPQLRFYSRLTQPGDQGSLYRIMVTTGDPTNLSSYDQIIQWTEFEINPVQDDYIEKVVDMPATYVGQSVYVAFVMLGDNGDRWLVDNVQVIEQCLPPTDLGVDNVSLDSADLTWNNPSGASSFEIEFLPAADIPTGNGDVYNGLPPYNVTGLDENTEYKYYVKSLCDDGGESEWEGPFYFSTVALGATCEAAIEIATLPYSTTDNTSTYGDDYSGSPGASGCGSTFGYLNGDDVVYEYTATEDGTISIDMTDNGNYSGMFVYENCDDIGVSCVAGGVGGFQGNPVSIPDFSVTSGQTYYIVISTWASPQSTPYTLTIQQVFCAPPEGLPTTNIGQTSADLSWTNPSGATSWEVVVQAPGAGIPAGSGDVAATNTNYEVSGLTAATAYEYYVRADCNDGNFSTWSGPYEFNTTICEAVDQCTYTFVLTDTFGDGWNGNTMTVSQNGITIEILGPTFTGGTGPVSIDVQMCNNLPFQLYWNAGGNFAAEVGVSIVNNFDQTLFEKGPGEGSQNTMLYEGTIDCDNPACLPPENLSADNATTTTAELSWTPATGEWEYYIVEEGGAAPTDADSGTNTDVVPTPVSGLTAATNYEYYVRTVCDVDEYSTWAGPFAFNTTVCEPEDQCNYVFELTDSFGDGWNGNTMTVSQGGVPIAIIGPTFTGGTGPVTVEVPLCPDVEFTVFWNAGGGFPAEVGLTIYDPFSEDVYTKPAGTGSQNTLLYTGIGNCTPPSCPKPQNLAVDMVTTDSATLSWTEMGSTDTWEVWILPPGSPEPTEPGTTTGDNPYLAEGLDSGTPYVYYVRANCGDEDGYSNWSGPFTFVTELENDDCDGAVDVPVNPDADCIDFVSGTITGSTGSGVDLSCVTWMDIEYDAWYSFVAETGTHSVTINNQVGATFNLAIFEGDDCGTLTELSCGGNSETITGLTPGETYYVMVYTTFFSNPTAITSFDVCVKTPVPPITVNDTQYTMEELVQDVLIGVDCAIVSNVESISGSDFGQSSSIGYFDQNGSDFPFTNGIVMATGGITEAPGPWPGDTTFDNGGWPGDADLSAIIAEGGNTGPLNNASVLEFDFVPFMDEISFNFLFASSEYGTFQCTFSDAFAFILTGPTTDVNGDNLAVIPGTTIPVSVVNIRDEAYNAGCDSQNPDYFAQYNPDNPEASPIGYNGQTQVMQAQATVTPGETYHIKLVIADYNDSAVNSAVFLDGGSFAIGAPDLGSDLTIEGGNAACAGEEIVLDTEMDPDTYDFKWFLGEDEIVGETEPSLTVTESGVYTVEVLYEDTECTVETTKTVEYYDPVEDVTGNPEDLTICDASGFGEFDLSVNDTPILDGSDPAENYEITYYLTQEDAENASNALGAIYTNEEQYQQTIYVRIENLDNGCFAVKQFELIIQDLTPEFDITEDFSICDGTTGTIEITATNYDPNSPDVSYSWTLNNDPLPDTTSTITVEDEGIYEVTINNTGCEATATVSVIVTPIPVADTPADVTECDSYILPALSANNNYYTGPDGTGDMLAAGDIISSTQTIYVLADSGTEPSCTDESSFVVTITTTPDFNLGGPYVSCVASNVTIAVNANNFNTADATYAWTVNGVASTATGSSIQGTEFGTYEVTVTVDNCSSTQSVALTQDTTAIAIMFEEGCEDGIYMVNVMDIDGSFNPDTSSYAWTGPNGFSETTQEVVIPEAGDYTVTVTTEDGCIGSTVVNVIDTSCSIPRGISPNNDNMNDTFDLTSLGVTQISIFNRYGTEVFSYGAYTNQWHGQGSNGDELPTGTYFYSLKRSNGESKTGWVYINREQ